ncbi:MAG: hypothetical protein ACPGR2_06260 [Psychrobium sp.]
MSYRNIITNIEESSYDSILDMDESELDNELTHLNVDVEHSILSFQKMNEEAALSIKKNKLKKARILLDQQKAHQSQTSKISSFLERKGLDAKDYLIELLMSGRTTLAFRDGQDLSEDEALSIIDNLIELGDLDINE